MTPVLIKLINMGDPDDWDLYAQQAVSSWIETDEYKKIQSFGLTADSYKYHDENNWGGNYNLSGCGVYCDSYDPKNLTLALLAGVIPTN
tara:strand:- start:2040 stop:2306 length:267 start_codon:yes stop_codon:yes gene_type:complete